LFYPGTGAIRRKETHFANTLIGEVCHAGAAFAYHAVRCFFTGETRLDRQNLDVQLCEAKAHRVRSCCAWQILPIVTALRRQGIEKLKHHNLLCS
jgi:hypothetical protein